MDRGGCTLRKSIAVVALIAAAPPLLSGQGPDQESAWAQADSVVVVGESQIRLRSYAWRDFMPRLGEITDGSDLMVNLQIQSLGEVSLPTGLSVDSAWVRCSAGRWGTSPSRESRPDLPNGMDLVLRGGPKWSTGQNIDVLVRLRLPNGEVRYVQSRGQSIGRTE
jgi:hypothetical protein